MNNLQSKRKALFAEMGAIDTMHRGRLTEEYRERRVDGEIRRLGPYYKYQVWENGRNKSRRVKPEEVEHLREGIQGLDRFKELSQQYIDATIAMNEQMQQEDSQDSKKNFA